MSESERLTAYEGFTMPIFGDEPPCNYGCKYCFAAEEGFRQDEPTIKPESLDHADRQLRATLGSSVPEVCTLVSSRFHELFAVDPQAGLEHVRRLAGYRKNVSVLTKTALDAETVDGLQEVDKQLMENDNRLVIGVSFVSGEERPDLEVNAPTVQARIDTTNLLADRGMCAGVCIGPVFPQEIVPTEELHTLVERTHDHVDAYSVARRFYYTDEMARKLGFEPSADHESHTTHGHPFPLMEDPTFSGWHIYWDPRVDPFLEWIRQKGRGAFTCDLYAVDYLIEKGELHRASIDVHS